MGTPGSEIARKEKRGLFWDLRQQILRPDLSPERIAWSFAIGLSIAFNPMLGTHTWMAFACCALVRALHRQLLITATFLNNPWTVLPIFGFSALFGNILLGRGWAVDLTGISLKSIGVASFTSRRGLLDLYSMLEPILAPYLVGGFLVSILALPVGYRFMLALTRRMRKTHSSNGD